MKDQKNKSSLAEILPIEDLFKVLVENTLDIISLLDVSGNILYQSPSVESLMGYTQSELLGVNVTSLIHPEDIEEAVGKLQRLAEGVSKTEKQELRFKDKPGNWRDIDVVGRRFEYGEHMGLILTTRDVTESRALLDDLKQSNELFQTAFHVSSNIGSLSTFETGEFIDVNRAWEETTGWPREEAIGKNAIELNIWGDDEGRKRVLLGLQEHGRLERRPVVLYRKTGEQRELLVDAKVLMVSGSKCIYLSAVDQTATKMLEEQLRQSQKMEAVGQLTGGIAHDFNNLLSVILGNAEFIKIQLGENSGFLSAIDAIVRSTKRGAALTQQLLAFSRKQALSPSSVLLSREVENTVAMLNRSLGEDVDVLTKFPDELWSCRVDLGQFENSILNLALNSRDAMPGGGSISIEYSNKCVNEDNEIFEGVARGDYVEIVFSDSGKGIPAESIGQVFEPFYTTKDIGKGTGLGLSMVYGFVKQSKGHVSVASVEGKGTTVSILLPRSESDELKVVQQAKAGDKLDGNGKKVLLIEDNTDVRELTSSMLEALNFQVYELSDGEYVEPLLLKVPDIDLLICDVILPGQFKGPDIARIVKTKTPSITVLLMSGFAQADTSNTNDNEDPIPLISKPFSAGELAEKISNLDL